MFDPEDLDPTQFLRAFINSIYASVNAEAPAEFPLDP